MTEDDGIFYDKDGRYKGRIVDGYIYDENSNYKGRIDEHSNFYDRNGRYLGRRIKKE